jgi:hypothetical protein
MLNPILSIAWKRLSNIDLPKSESASGELTSNQHEIQGISPLKKMFGLPVGDQKLRFRARWLIHADDGSEPAASESEVVWYDTRWKNPHRNAEYRLYYKPETGLGTADVGDLLVVIQLDPSLAAGGPEFVFHVVPQHSELFGRVKWALNMGDAVDRTTLRAGADVNPGNMPLSRLQVLWDMDPVWATTPEWSTEQSLVDDVRDVFAAFLADPEGVAFPRGVELAEYAQSKARWSDADPDSTLEDALRIESLTFATLERAGLELRLKRPFENVDDFISYSLSVQNRRKARRGRSLEYQLEWVFRGHQLSFETQVAADKTRTTVDFLFPSKSVYAMKKPPITFGVVALAAKSTCKDRWRQILTEAQNLPTKHLFTLETGISSSQTAEMGANRVTLVVPKSAVDSYDNPGTEILDLAGFIQHLEKHVR